MEGVGSYTILDFGFWILDFGFWILDWGIPCQAGVLEIEIMQV